MVLHSYISVPFENNNGNIEYMRINLEELCKSPVIKKPEPTRQPSVITKLCDIFYKNTKI